jgi:uncharacterized protein YggE
MKKLIILFVISTVLTLGFTSVSFAGEQRVVSVIGEAEIRVVPDEVLIALGVENRDPVLNTAIKQNNDQLRKIMSVIAKFAIDPKLIQTSQIELRPIFNQDSHQKLDGYEVNQTISLTIRNTGQFEEILKKLLEAGVNRILGITFNTTELAKYRARARAMAIQAAKEKAAMLAKELGQQIGKPQNISEVVQPNYSDYSGLANFSQSYGSNSQTGETFAAGQIRVSAKIAVDFELLE